MASTRVVLPWSTWAMIATLRMSLRRVMGSSPPGVGAGLGIRGRGRRAGTSAADVVGEASIARLGSNIVPCEHPSGQDRVRGPQTAPDPM